MPGRCCEVAGSKLRKRRAGQGDVLHTCDLLEQGGSLDPSVGHGHGGRMRPHVGDWAEARLGEIPVGWWNFRVLWGPVDEAFLEGRWEGE